MVKAFMKILLKITGEKQYKKEELSFPVRFNLKRILRKEVKINGWTFKMG